MTYTAPSLFHTTLYCLFVLGHLVLLHSRQTKILRFDGSKQSSFLRQIMLWPICNLLVESSINMQFSHFDNSGIEDRNFFMAVDVSSRNVMVADTGKEWLCRMKYNKQTLSPVYYSLTIGR